jgi:hypothetical protein
MRISESLRDQLPSQVKEHVFKTSRGDLMLPFYEWSLAELNVPPYPEIRVYHQVARQLCLLDTNQQVNGLIVKERPALKDGSSMVTLTYCSDLLSPKQGPLTQLLKTGHLHPGLEKEIAKMSSVGSAFPNTIEVKAPQGGLKFGGRAFTRVSLPSQCC